MTHTEYMRVHRARWIERIGPRADPWTPDDDATALEMRSRRRSYGQIAFRVRRTPGAVAARLHYLERRQVTA